MQTLITEQHKDTLKNININRWILIAGIVVLVAMRFFYKVSVLNLTRIKAVLTEKQLTGKWLADRINKSENTISRRCSNKVQPSLENLYEIAKVLDIEVHILVVPPKSPQSTTFLLSRVLSHICINEFFLFLRMRVIRWRLKRKTVVARASCARWEADALSKKVFW